MIDVSPRVLQRNLQHTDRGSDFVRLADALATSGGGPVELASSIPWWVTVVGIVIASAFAAITADRALSSFLSRTAGSKSRGTTTTTTTTTAIEAVQTPLSATVFLFGVYLGAAVVPNETVTFFLESAAGSLIAIVWAYAVIRIGNRLLTPEDPERSGRDIVPILKNSVSATVILTTGLLLLSIWEVDVTPILASAGVVGILVGIAARDSIGNFFAGASLYFDRTYSIGDMIQLESGERGTVVDMSIRSTTILTRDNVAITVPNAELNSTQILNESAPGRRRRIRLNVGVAYGSDLDAVEAVLLEVADAEDLVLNSPPPDVKFREFGESAITTQLQCHIEYPAQRGEARDRLVRGIARAFEEAGVEIPFPQREVTFLQAENGIVPGSNGTPAEATSDDD